MEYMFTQAIKFNQNLEGWQTDNVANMTAMFKDAFDFSKKKWKKPSPYRRHFKKCLGIFDYMAVMNFTEKGWQNQ